MTASHQPPVTTPLPELPNHMMTIPEVAEYLNVSARWVEDAVQHRRIRHTRFGKHVRIPPAAVAELIHAGERPVVVPAEGSPAVPLHDRRRSRL